MFLLCFCNYSAQVRWSAQVPLLSENMTEKLYVVLIIFIENNEKEILFQCAIPPAKKRRAVYRPLHLKVAHQPKVNSKKVCCL